MRRNDTVEEMDRKNELKNNTEINKIASGFSDLYSQLILSKNTNPSDVLLGLIICKRNKLTKDDKNFKLINLVLMKLELHGFYSSVNEQKFITTYRDYKKAQESSLFFTGRKMDFERHSSKLLLKDFCRFFKPNNAKSVQIVGVKSKGVYLKEPKNNEFFIANHDIREYFAVEVFNLIGIFTPKTRIIFDDNKPGIASKAIENYIPIAGVRHDIPYIHDDKKSSQKINDIRKRYQLDIEKQVVVDLETKQKCKISGHLFGTDEAAILVDEHDLQPHDCNLGLVRLGNRFYACAIDKEECEFYKDGHYDNFYHNGSHYDKLRFVAKSVNNSLYKNRLEDQRLAVINKIYLALQKQQLPGEDKPCSNFERIFFNPRVLATFESHLELKKVNIYKIFSNLMEAANIMLEHFEADLPGFRIRDKIRETIAENVIDQLRKLRLLTIVDEEPLKRIIIEDLRAPYYQIYFTNKKYVTNDDTNNNKLINQIVDDLKHEFNFSEISVLPDPDITSKMKQMLEILSDTTVQSARVVLENKFQISLNESNVNFFRSLKVEDVSLKILIQLRMAAINGDNEKMVQSGLDMATEYPAAIVCKITPAREDLPMGFPLHSLSDGKSISPLIYCALRSYLQAADSMIALLTDELKKIALKQLIEAKEQFLAASDSWRLSDLGANFDHVINSLKQPQFRCLVM